MIPLYPTMKIVFVVVSMILPDGKLKITTREYKNETCRSIIPMVVPNLVRMARQTAGRGRVIKPAQIKDWAYTCHEFDPGQNA